MWESYVYGLTLCRHSGGQSQVNLAFRVISAQTSNMQIKKLPDNPTPKFFKLSPLDVRVFKLVPDIVGERQV